MSQTFKGHCHCGAVEWEVELPSDSQGHILCHCNACKLQSGGEYTLNQIAPKDAFKLTKGDLKVYTYKGDSGNPVDCFFCVSFFTFYKSISPRIGYTISVSQSV